MTVAPVRATCRMAITPRWAAISLALLAAALMLCGVAQAESDVPTHAVVFGSLALAFYAAALLCLVATREGDFGLARWKLGSWILLWYGLAFGLATVTWSEPEASAPAQIAVSSVLRALLLVAVGTTCWATGYFVGPGRYVRRLSGGGMEQ